MKKFIYIFCATIICSSCKKLLKVDPPTSQIENKVVFSSDVTATAAVLGIYVTYLSNGFACGNNTGVLSLAALSSDEMFHTNPENKDMIEFEKNQLTAENTVLLPIWSSIYQSIYQANSILEGLQQSTGIGDAAKRQLSAEAYFARAYAYFYAVNLFGDVPLAMSTDYITNSKLPRTATSEIYAKIKEDLQTAETLIDEEYLTMDYEKVRPNKATVRALLARVHLYMGSWAEAEASATAVIADEARYALTPVLTDVFLTNSSEAIWQLRNGGNSNTGRTNEAYFFSPESAVENHLLTEDLVQSFEPGDKRKAAWVGDVTFNGKPAWHMYKYKQYVFSGPLTEYSMVFRLAEQYLIRAEARAKQNKLTGPASAASDIDSIRHRAGLPPTTATTLPEIMESIMQERRIELFVEAGHRWMDLKRWGKAGEVLSIIKGNNWQATDVLYPVPLTELDKNPALNPQNDGY